MAKIPGKPQLDSGGVPTSPLAAEDLMDVDLESPGEENKIIEAERSGRSIIKYMF